MATELGAGPDEIAGDTVPRFAFELFSWCEKNDKAYELMVSVIKRRPDSKWN